jgi:Xaa-Pro aminopeptidase
MYHAVFEAREAAIASVRPGVKAAEVDAAARQVLKGRGFEREFMHGTGHAVGFAAIDHLARPRLHPASPDVLEAGMVFNVEPALYFPGFGGIRHCDMVLATESGAEVLTPFHRDFENCILPGELRPVRNYGSRAPRQSKHRAHPRKASFA